VAHDLFDVCPSLGRHDRRDAGVQYKELAAVNLLYPIFSSPETVPTLTGAVSLILPSPHRIGRVVGQMRTSALDVADGAATGHKGKVRTGKALLRARTPMRVRCHSLPDQVTCRQFGAALAMLEER